MLSKFSTHFGSVPTVTRRLIIPSQGCTHRTQSIWDRFIFLKTSKVSALAAFPFQLVSILVTSKFVITVNITTASCEVMAPFKSLMSDMMSSSLAEYRMVEADARAYSCTSRVSVQNHPFSMMIP